MNKQLEQIKAKIERLKTAYRNWVENHKDGEILYCKDAFIAGAEWQKEQMLNYVDLPVWKKWKGGVYEGGEAPVAIVRNKYGNRYSYILTSCLDIYGEEYIMLSDLEKLPKEDEK